MARPFLAGNNDAALPGIEKARGIQRAGIHHRISEDVHIPGPRDPTTSQGSWGWYFDEVPAAQGLAVRTNISMKTVNGRFISPTQRKWPTTSTTAHHGPFAEFERR